MKEFYFYFFIDATIKDNENDLTVDNNPNEFSRAGLDKTNEVMFNETTNIDSKYLSKLINDSHGSKKMTSISKIFMIICTAVSVLGMWGVILYMSVEFSERGGYLWGWWFWFTSVMSFLWIEPAHVLASSVLLIIVIILKIYNKNETIYVFKEVIIEE